MSSGGFDAVIGNPPWISLSGKFRNEIYTPNEIEYLKSKYQGNTYMPNMYEYFVSLGISIAKDGGYFSFIVPDRLGFNRQFVALRDRIVRETSVLSLIYKVPFPNVVVDTVVFRFRKGKVNPKHEVEVSEHGGPVILLSQQAIRDDPEHKFEYFESEAVRDYMTRIALHPRTKTLSNVCKVTSGFGGKSPLITDEKINDGQVRALKGDSITRYHIRRLYWFDFRPENITGRTTDKQKLGASPKILVRKTGDRIIAAYDDSGMFPEQSLYFLYQFSGAMSPKFILGVLNSSTLNGYFRSKSLTNKKSIGQVKTFDLESLPVPQIDFESEDDRALHDRVVALVNRLEELSSRLASARTPNEHALLSRQADVALRQIDKEIFALYGVTPEEASLIDQIA